MNKLITVIILLSLSSFTQAEPLKIASWNIAWLGSHGYNKRVDDDYKQLANYASQLDADVIALQEVEDGEWASKVLGDGYDYYFSTRNYVQRVGVAVKKSSGYKVTSREYKALDVGRVRYGMDLTLTNGDKQLRLLAVHLKSGCFAKPLDNETVTSMPDSSKRNVKEKRACTKLSKQIEPLESWIDERAKEGIPFMVLGDFNRRFAIDIENSLAEDQGLWQAIDDEGSEDLWTPTLTKNSKCWGGYYKDYIDHIVLDPRAKAMFVIESFSQLVFDGKYTKELSRSLSDHCPISVELEL
ncbi:MAG: endonuclease/exonuclease/phosphatase family protein [Colwellia sp.]|nr:endonuclease/exonuclease/phosphatase family protein [Colwellia sp.]